MVFSPGEYAKPILKSLTFPIQTILPICFEFCSYSVTNYKIWIQKNIFFLVIFCCCCCCLCVCVFGVGRGFSKNVIQCTLSHFSGNIFLSLVVVVSIIYLCLPFIFFSPLVAGLHRTNFKHNWQGHVRRASVAPQHPPCPETVWESALPIGRALIQIGFQKPILSWSQCMYLLFDSKPALPSPRPRLCIRLISVVYVFLLFFFQ